MVELLVAVAIIMVLAGGVFVYVGSFRASQELEAAKKELVSALRLARNYALTWQTPETDELEFVEVNVSSEGVVEARPNGVGTTYFSVDVTKAGVGVSLTADSLMFAVYSGKLLKDAGGSLVPREAGEEVRAIISSTQVGETRVVQIEPWGLINER